MDARQMVIASSYREGAVLAIARAAARRHRLERFFTTLYWPRFGPAARAIPFAEMRDRATKALDQRSMVGVPAEKVETAATFAEIGRVAAVRLPFRRSVASARLYATMRSFDGAIAKRLNSVEAEVIVTMYGSSSLTLAAAQARNMTSALNFVGSHPRVHNRLLGEMAGLPSGHHEMVPPRTTDEIERELELAAMVLVPSRFVSRQLLEFGVDASKIQIQSYGVNLDAFFPDANRREHALQDDLSVLFVGHISHRKGIPVLLEAARRLQGKPVRFTVMGPVVSPETIEAVPSNVQVLQSGGHASVADHMRSASVFVLPTIEDAYPLVTLEAMASGMATVVSDHAGTSELIRHGENGLVVPAGDVGALEDAINRFLDEPELVTVLGARARETVVDGHSWDDYGDRVVDLLSRDVGAGGTPTPS